MIGCTLFSWLMRSFAIHFSPYFTLLPVVLTLYWVTRQKLPDNHSCNLLSSYRLEDQTKKLHKDMKKSTEADLGVFCHQPVCSCLVGHWSPLVHQHTWCCMAGFFPGPQRRAVALVCLVVRQLSKKIDKLRWKTANPMPYSSFTGFSRLCVCKFMSVCFLCTTQVRARFVYHLCLCLFMYLSATETMFTHFLFAYLLVLELCI